MLEHHRALMDKHKGKPGLLVLNGPGLKNIPLEFLNKHVSFGCNRISLMYPDFCPTYYGEMGGNHLDTEAKRATFVPLVMDARCLGAFVNRRWIHEFAHTNKFYTWTGGGMYGVSTEETGRFSYNPMFVVGLGNTMAFPMLQVMLYMGFDPVLIVGMDHNYPETKDKHFYADDERYAGLFEIAPGPYTPEAWRRGADDVLGKCREAYDKAGRRILNLSTPTLCEVFERGSLEDWWT